MQIDFYLYPITMATDSISSGNTSHARRVISTGSCGFNYHTTLQYTNVRTVLLHTVWPEIVAGRYFGGLVKVCHLAEFTLAVTSVLAI